MTDPYRILVTGSRTWGGLDTIASALNEAIEEQILTSGASEIVVVHGACPQGADRLAAAYCESLTWPQRFGRSVTVEPHRAEDFGPWPACGPRRNAHMVSLGANVCLAFILPCTKPNCRKPRPHGSHGATGCADLAERASIPVRKWTA